PRAARALEKGRHAAARAIESVTELSPASLLARNDAPPDSTLERLAPTSSSSSRSARRAAAARGRGGLGGPADESGGRWTTGAAAARPVEQHWEDTARGPTSLDSRGGS